MRGLLASGLLFASLFASTLAFAETLSGRVVGVPDGDTLTLLDSSNGQHNVRLSGVDLGRVGPVP